MSRAMLLKSKRVTLTLIASVQGHPAFLIKRHVKRIVTVLTAHWPCAIGMGRLVVFKTEARRA